VVRDNLPDIIKDKVSESQTSWKAFCNAIKAVDLSHIRDGMRKYKEREADKQAIAARLAQLESGRSVIPASPTAAIRGQMSCTTISLNTVSGGRQTGTAQNPFNTGGGCRNLFTPAAQCAPATEAQKQALCLKIADHPLQPDTPDGQNAYHSQCCTWKEHSSVDYKATEMTGFPLHPGSAPVCSGECYACGKTGHNCSNCTATGTSLANPQEQAWRAICGSMLGHNHPQEPAAVNVVRNVDEDDLNWLGLAGTEDRGEQGNGGGPSA
jgi:hypothetical protein